MSRGEFEVLWAEMAIRDLEQIVDFIAQKALSQRNGCSTTSPRSLEPWRLSPAEAGLFPSLHVSRSRPIASSSSALSGSFTGLTASVSSWSPASTAEETWKT
jgi:plasmid stabilization system protein ParE